MHCHPGAALRSGFALLATGLAATSLALAQNTSQLAENGWYSDDTRADGEGSEPAGTNLIGPSLTDAPEGTSGVLAHEADIRRQITFGAAPGTVPGGTHAGAVHLSIGASGSGKSQISHRKDDGVGHASGADAFGPATQIRYTWMGDGTPTVTTSFKLGVKTADFVSTGVSGRTGENAWDKVLVYEPGNLNGGTSNGTWTEENVDFTTGLWWFFDRTAGASTIGMPMTLDAMSTSTATFGAGPKTVADVYALITAPGAHVTSVQFGIGSGNAGGSVYAGELETSFYRAGSVTTFGDGLLTYDDDVTNEVLFGSGNLNGEFTLDRRSGVELGLRGKLRFNAANVAENTFNSGGDGTYTMPTGAPTGGAGWVEPDTPRWNFEWSVNTDFDGSSGTNLDAYTYELGIDVDPSAATLFIAFDPIDGANHPSGFFDHAIGTNATGNGGGTTATSAASYLALLASNNIAQNSWNVEFFDAPPFDVFDADAEGRYDVYLAAFDGGGNEVARTEIAVLAERALEYDQDVTNEAIFGSGNGNGAFTTDRANGVEVGVRGKLRFPVPMGVYNSNGDGTYTFDTGSFGGNASWAYDWSMNVDYDGSTGAVLDGLTYQMGLDFDPTTDTDYLLFDPITSGSTIPYATPVTVPWWDHSIGTNATANGAGVEATDLPSYLALIAANNLAQNSWRHTFYDEPPFGFDPTIPGRYDVFLAASDASGEIARSEIAFYAMDGSTLLVEAEPCQGDARPGVPGLQIEHQVWMRNLQQGVTGYQAFLTFDAASMTFEGAESAYTGAPFGLNITPMTFAETAPGELRIDGSVAPGGAATSGDALLATLVFTVDGCSTGNIVAFDAGGPFQSEFSDLGSPLATSLVNSGAVTADAEPPLLSPVADIVVAADAGIAGGCDSAVVNYTLPTATDTCTAVDLVCTPPPGTAFPAGETTRVTCIATDACGNTATQTFDVTVTETNVFQFDVELTGVTTPVTRCLHLSTDDCSSVDVQVAFVDHDANAATPVRATATVEIPCGPTTAVCVKDEQHTLWSTTTVSLSGTTFVGDTLVQLDGGDTDNDGDVDINDVTLFIAQFGDAASPGGCGWNGTRDADFDANGVVGTPDYTFLTANWLRTSACSCTSPGGIHLPSVDDGRLRKPAAGVVGRMADLNGDGWNDVRDVRLFERRAGLDGSLSAAMLRAHVQRRGR